MPFIKKNVLKYFDVTQELDNSYASLIIKLGTRIRHILHPVLQVQLSSSLFDYYTMVAFVNVKVYLSPVIGPAFNIWSCHATELSSSVTSASQLITVVPVCLFGTCAKVTLNSYPSVFTSLLCWLFLPISPGSIPAARIRCGYSGAYVGQLFQPIAVLVPLSIRHLYVQK